MRSCERWGLGDARRDARRAVTNALRIRRARNVAQGMSDRERSAVSLRKRASSICKTVDTAWARRKRSSSVGAVASGGKVSANGIAEDEILEHPPELLGNVLAKTRATEAAASTDTRPRDAWRSLSINRNVDARISQISQKDIAVRLSRTHALPTRINNDICPPTRFDDLRSTSTCEPLELCARWIVVRLANAPLRVLVDRALTLDTMLRIANNSRAALINVTRDIRSAARLLRVAPHSLGPVQTTVTEDENLFGGFVAATQTAQVIVVRRTDRRRAGAIRAPRAGTRRWCWDWFSRS